MADMVYKFYIGSPCKRGHDGKRYLSGNCVSCSKEWQDKNKDIKRRCDKIYRDNNKTKISDFLKNWRKKNVEKVNENKRVSEAKRRANKKGSFGSHTVEDVKNIYQLQSKKCAICKQKLKSKFHADHIVPLKLGGSNEKKNIQILCASCNLKKHAKDPIVFAQENGLLL